MRYVQGRTRRTWTCLTCVQGVVRRVFHRRETKTRRGKTQDEFAFVFTSRRRSFFIARTASARRARRHEVPIDVNIISSRFRKLSSTVVFQGEQSQITSHGDPTNILTAVPSDIFKFFLYAIIARVLGDSYCVLVFLLKLKIEKVLWIYRFKWVVSTPTFERYKYYEFRKQLILQIVHGKRFWTALVWGYCTRS